MKARFIVFALLIAATVGLSSAVANGGARGHDSTGPPDESVAAWDATGVRAFAAAGLTPADGHVLFAYSAIAVYDTVMAINGGYEPFANDIEASKHASVAAAVAAAAHRVFAHYLPAQATAILDPDYATALAAIPDGKAKADGVATGEKVADLLIAERANDGFRAAFTYTPPSPPIPGVWLPTAPTPPVGTYLAHMRPFSLRSADQFRPDGPPALSSRRWARDYNETKEIGSSTSTTRTSEQTSTARFWGEPPIQQTRAALQKFVRDHQLDVVDAARFMAMASVVYADADIACYEAKYHYAFWRPITAIHAGDTDGNDATVADPAWTPLISTPNHPDYPAAHACITPAGGLVVARFLGTRRIDFTVPSLTGLGDRTFARPRDLREEVENARIWGGIHSRSAVEDGAALGRKVVNQVLGHHFRRSDDDNERT
jgi:hypothetical protein